MPCHCGWCIFSEIITQHLEKDFFARSLLELKWRYSGQHLGNLWPSGTSGPFEQPCGPSDLWTTSSGPLGNLWATPGCPSGQILGNFLGDLWETTLVNLRKPCIGNVRVEALHNIRDRWWRKDSFYFPRLSNKMVKLYFLLLLFQPYSEKNRGQKIGNIMEDYLGHRT